MVPGYSFLTGGGILDIVVQNPAPGDCYPTASDGGDNVPTIFGVFNAASYASGTVSPGELVTMFGENIGPPIPATMSPSYAGYVTTKPK